MIYGFFTVKSSAWTLKIDDLTCVLGEINKRVDQNTLPFGKETIHVHLGKESIPSSAVAKSSLQKSETERKESL